MRGGLAERPVQAPPKARYVDRSLVSGMSGSSIPLLHDAEPEMRYPAGLDHIRAFQFDLPGAKVVEESDAFSEQDGH